MCQTAIISVPLVLREEMIASGGDVRVAASVWGEIKTFPRKNTCTNLLTGVIFGTWNMIKPILASILI